MGFYVEVPENKNKAQQLADLYGATILPQQPKTFEDVPEGLALICVVDNGPFEAAALCYSNEEFAAFAAPDNVGPSTLEDQGGLTVLSIRSERQRPRTWVLLDQAVAHELAGYA